MTIHPAFVLIFGALLVPLFKGRAKSMYVISLPVLALLAVYALPEGDYCNLNWLAGFGEMTLLRSDKLAKAFGFIFTINAALTDSVSSTTQPLQLRMHVSDLATK